MPSRKPKSAVWDAAQETAKQIHGQDIQATAKAEQDRLQRSTLKLQQILDRTTDTRELRQQHVDQLAESIAVLGLIEPLVVDIKGQLLAGGHRKAAIYALKETQPKTYQQHFPADMVPVRVMQFDADQDPDRALQVEISENEKRRDYTPAEVRYLASRLRIAGYSDTPGRPAKNEKRLRPALEIIVGKSLRSVRRYLTDEKPVQSGQVSKRLALRQARKALNNWLSLPEEERSSRYDQRLTAKSRDMLALVDKLLSQV